MTTKVWRILLYIYMKNRQREESRLNMVNWTMRENEAEQERRYGPRKAAWAETQESGREKEKPWEEDV